MTTIQVTLSRRLFRDNVPLRKSPHDGEYSMLISRWTSAAALVAVVAAFFTDVASSVPFNNALAIRTAALSVIETVQCCDLEWDRESACCYERRYFGEAVIVPYYDRPRFYYPDGAYSDRRYYYLAPGDYAGPPVDAGAVAYCARRFRSYDPRSGTYLGNDGYRHPCP